MRCLRPATLLLALAADAAAQEPPFARESIELMPGLEREQRQVLYSVFNAANRDAVRLRQIDQGLAKKPSKQEAAKLTKERDGLRARLAAAPAATGLPDPQLRRLLEMPRGPLRQERYNHGVLLETPGLTDGQRALLVRLIAAADAAQATALVQRDHLVRGLGDEDKLVAARIRSTCDQQRNGVERRFWRVAYHVLTPEQMRAARTLLSPRYQQLSDMPAQLYLLPELTPSQGVRLRSLYAEGESENAADLATVRRNATRLRQGGLTAEERAALGRENGEAYGRMGGRNAALAAAVQATLTAEQREALDARPPFLNTGELQQAPWDLVGDVRLAGGQPDQVRRLREDAGRFRRELAQAGGGGMMATMMAELGPESPQMMAVETARQATRSRVIDHMREAGQLLFLEILSPAQVCGWVVAPSLAP